MEIVLPSIPGGQPVFPIRSGDDEETAHQTGRQPDRTLFFQFIFTGSSTISPGSGQGDKRAVKRADILYDQAHEPLLTHLHSASWCCSPMWSAPDRCSVGGKNP